jgi:hypothetical protein
MSSAGPIMASAGLEKTTGSRETSGYTLSARFQLTEAYSTHSRFLGVLAMIQPNAHHKWRTR